MFTVYVQALVVAMRNSTNYTTPTSKKFLTAMIHRQGKAWTKMVSTPIESSHQLKIKR
jgi:hypothetical protein